MIAMMLAEVYFSRHDPEEKEDCPGTEHLEDIQELEEWEEEEWDDE